MIHNALKIPISIVINFIKYMYLLFIKRIIKTTTSTCFPKIRYKRWWNFNSQPGLEPRNEAERISALPLSYWDTIYLLISYTCYLKYNTIITIKEFNMPFKREYNKQLMILFCEKKIQVCSNYVKSGFLHMIILLQVVAKQVSTGSRM